LSEFRMEKDTLSIDSGVETRKVVRFIREVVKKADAKGVVLGLSGGIDSSVVGSLCVKALGRRRVLGLIMPSDHTPRNDTEDARTLSREWGIEVVEAQISPLVAGLVSVAGAERTRIADANAQARIRMAVLYYHANVRSYLVAGTGDRSEALLGYFTKWGDGGADFLPIAHLFKTQVQELGRYLGLPEQIVVKPPSPQLWPGHRASDELPAGYDRLDVFFHCLFDLKMSANRAASKAGVPFEVAKQVLEMNRRSAHKRALPPSLA
jgi:NAD+ synthase